MEKQTRNQGAQIEGDQNHITQDQSVNIQINLAGAVVDKFVVLGGMHIYLRFGQEEVEI